MAELEAGALLVIEDDDEAEEADVEADIELIAEDEEPAVELAGELEAPGGVPPPFPNSKNRIHAMAAKSSTPNTMTMLRWLLRAGIASGSV